MGKQDLPEVIIKYKGIFNFDSLFKISYDWLIHQGFLVQETKYKHKIPTPKGSEQEIGWISQRKVNTYVSYGINVDFKFWDLKEVEVVKENEKKKLSYAKIRIIITPVFETDYSNKFGGSAFLQGLMAFFNKFIYRQDLNDYYGDQLYYRAYKLHRVLKEFLDMETKTNAFEGRW